MRISEIFYSIQGEGTNIGQPAIFTRLAGCHLRCVWCDSKFTWNMKSGKEMSTTEIIQKIRKFPCTHLVITGGEPLIQQSGIKDLIVKLQQKKKFITNNSKLKTIQTNFKNPFFIEIETSGSLSPQINEYIDQYNCSPKLGNSKNRPINYQLSLSKFPAEKTWYKFVIDQPADLREVKNFIKKHKLPQNRIILMPQGITREEIAERSIWLAKICKKENWRYSTRLHIEIWGNKRGV